MPSMIRSPRSIAAILAAGCAAFVVESGVVYTEVEAVNVESLADLTLMRVSSETTITYERDAGRDVVRHTQSSLRIQFEGRVDSPAAVVEVGPITTHEMTDAAGRPIDLPKIDPHQIHQGFQAARGRGDHPNQIQLWIDLRIPHVALPAVIGRLSGSLPVGLASGPNREVHLSPFEELNGRRVQIKDMPDLTFRISRDGNQFELHFDRDHEMRIAKIASLTADGRRLDLRYSGSRSSNAGLIKLFRCPDLREGEAIHTLIVEVRPPTRRVDLAFQLTNIALTPEPVAAEPVLALASVPLGTPIKAVADAAAPPGPAQLETEPREFEIVD